MQLTNTQSITIDNIITEYIKEKLKKSEEEIEKGYGIEADIAFKELRQKYEY